MTADFFKALLAVYDSLCVEQSKHVFCARLLYNVSGEICHLKSIYYKGDRKPVNAFGTFNIDVTSFLKRITPLIRNSPVIIYGAGYWGTLIYPKLLSAGIDVECFWDRNAINMPNGIMGKKVISPQLKGKGFTGHIIVSTIYAEEISDELIANGFSPEVIHKPEKDEQEIWGEYSDYFDTEIIKLVDGEVFVDGGCYDFATSQHLLEICPNVKKIYAFECDDRSIPNCIRGISESGYANAELFRMGLWSSTCELTMNQEGTSGVISDSGSVTVKVTSIDEVIHDEVTFIKLDIEGAELEALKGSERTIKTYRPKLAVCVYHKPEDIIDIPLYLKSIMPDYRFYIRHYSRSRFETVLFAI